MLYIIKNGSAVLGRDLFYLLQMQVSDGGVTTATSNQSKASVASVTETGLRCAKQFVHKVKIHSDIKSVQQKLCRLHFSVRETVSKELNKLVDQDVTEPVESSEWISPIVVTTRKGRPDPRLCVDLRETNKSVGVDIFRVPHMEEMFIELRGATLFIHETSRVLTI